MPGPLANARHEKYCQLRFSGKKQADAYIEAGFADNTGTKSNASRFDASPEIQARIMELQAAAAEKAVVTAADIAAQLDEDRQFARELEAPAAAISATMGKAKVLGLLVEKSELTGKDGAPLQMADSELARLIVFQLTKATKQT